MTRPALRRPRSATARAAAAALLAAGALAACTGSGSHASPQTKVAEQFLAAFGARDVRGAARATDDPTSATAALTSSLDGLGTTAHGSSKVTSLSTKNARSTVAYTARWTLAGTSTPWTYSGTLPVRKVGTTWKVGWQLTDLYPTLPADTHLAVARVQPTRAALLDSTGKPLFTRTAVVRVGIEKKLVTDLGRLASTLAAIPQLQSTRADLVTAVQHAAPTAFVPVITLRRTVYDQIRARIYNLPGTVFQTDSLLLPPTAGFGQPLLGTVGQATQDLITRSRGRIVAGDTTGLGGLQQAYDPTLAGTAGVSVRAVPDLGGAPGRTLTVVTPARAGRPVTVSIEPKAQTAAEHALAGITKPAALVAVQRSTGRIVADANTAATTYDYGLAGAFPPGSTFKIATWAAAFTSNAGLRPSSTVSCPGTTTVDGRTFVNENRFSHPPISVADAFGYSCNTSAIAAALALPSTALADTARTLGLGGRWTLPVTAFSGSIPPPATRTERAADGIGQGRVLVSPLLMALLVSAADGGPVLPPTLVPTTAPTGRTLPRSLTAEMHTLLSAPVDLSGGTAHDLAGLGVVGKTGTAEYGTATPPRSHSWFTGVHGDLAFAVFVYDGATTHVDAVPIARSFLTAVR